MLGNALIRFLTILFCCLVFVACSSKESSQGELLSVDDASEEDNREVFDGDSGVNKPVGTYTDFIGNGCFFSGETLVVGLRRWEAGPCLVVR